MKDFCQRRTCFMPFFLIGRLIMSKCFQGWKWMTEFISFNKGPCTALVKCLCLCVEYKLKYWWMKQEVKEKQQGVFPAQLWYPCFHLCGQFLRCDSCCSERKQVMKRGLGNNTTLKLTIDNNHTNGLQNGWRQTEVNWHSMSTRLSFYIHHSDDSCVNSPTGSSELS